MPIDWLFIAREEGGQKLSAYVPTGPQRGNQSGVTIATGFDIGQRSVAEIMSLQLPQALKVKLVPYAGLKLQRAEAALRQQPLTITRAEANKIDQLIKRTETARLERAYNSAIGGGSGLKRFSQLPTEAQTVIASVAFQHGAPWVATPRFWRFAVAQNWFAVIQELENFGDQFPSRRKREAAFLRRMLKKAAFAP